MLEIKDIVRIYKPKKGAPVRALDGVSLRFPDKGMIFILGKSGSGKSTLLNVMGGLDKYDSGEIIIKDKSSRDFSQDDFDSYRNTYLGFIFQEYNILNEFSVGVNIGLALQLQGQKVTEDAINSILEEVDLQGYGNRKPNELSGGQKQRVAIARALVKNPEIIMADEPTGALDSATGLQVFDTLKKLSRDKLVLVVTHDREFAEEYGDRVIELKDGRVISDISKFKTEPANAASGLSIVDDAVIQIKKGYRLTPEDLDTINSYLATKDAVITLDDKLSDTVRRAAKLDKSGSKESFRDTDNSAITSDSGAPFKLIKSRLPFRHSFKMGASSLRHKRLRLVITIFLSVIAFGMFGLTDTVSAYNRVQTLVNSIEDTGVDYLSFSMEYRSEEGYSMWNPQMTDKDIAALEQKTGYDYNPVYRNYQAGTYYIGNYKNQSLLTTYYTSTLSGFMETTTDELAALGFAVTGSMPDSDDEIAITDYIYSHYKKAGYDDGSRSYSPEDISTVNDYLDINPVINIDGNNYRVTAVVDTKFSSSRYGALDQNRNEFDLVGYVMLNELQTVTAYGYHTVMFVKEGFTERFTLDDGQIGLPLQNIGSVNLLLSSGYGYSAIRIADMTTLREDNCPYILIDETAEDTLDENEILINVSDVSSYFYSAGYNDLTVDIYSNPSELRNYIDNNKTRIKQALSGIQMQYYTYFGYMQSEPADIQVKGFILGDDTSGMYAVSDTVYSVFDEIKMGNYPFAITKMPADTASIKKLAEFYYGQEESGKYYKLHNEVNVSLDMVNTLFEDLAKVFLYVGLGLALFAALMLTNYISTSIAYKKREIGILRAVGARSSDVFGIFFNESLLIAAINFVISVIATAAAVIAINVSLRSQYNILITFLNFGIRQIALMLGVSVLVAFVASFIPVMRIARKRPVDAINNR